MSHNYSITELKYKINKIDFLSQLPTIKFCKHWSKFWVQSVNNVQEDRERGASPPTNIFYITSSKNLSNLMAEKLDRERMEEREKEIDNVCSRGSQNKVVG